MSNNQLNWDAELTPPAIDLNNKAYVSGTLYVNQDPSIRITTSDTTTGLTYQLDYTADLESRLRTLEGIVYNLQMELGIMRDLVNKLQPLLDAQVALDKAREVIYG